MKKNVVSYNTVINNKKLGAFLKEETLEEEEEKSESNSQ
tara:strand:+ start:2457 stop:2573 length:117 start_codon:yes stop_codon:yes gene_type:complete